MCLEKSEFLFLEWKPNGFIREANIKLMCRPCRSRAGKAREGDIKMRGLNGQFLGKKYTLHNSCTLSEEEAVLPSLLHEPVVKLTLRTVKEKKIT